MISELGLRRAAHPHPIEVRSARPRARSEEGKTTGAWSATVDRADGWGGGGPRYPDQYAPQGLKASIVTMQFVHTRIIREKELSSPFG